MPIAFNHTIVAARDKRESAEFLAELFGLPSPVVSEDDFDAIYGKIQSRGLQHWADPGRQRPGQINTRDNGRGVYFPDPAGHGMEILTRPYGSGS
jgi:catechol 2,3-dioxygenase-like lactoylglutathione lyase family enzyme